MDAAQIAALMRPTGKKAPQAKGGRFEGKAGTLRRSSKGRTYRAPNGRRVFVDETWYERIPGFMSDTDTNP